MRTNVLAQALVVAVTLSGAPALAQQRTSATYDDWTLVCQVQSGDKPTRLCEVAQTLSVRTQEGQQVTIGNIALARPAAGQPMKIVLQLPIGVYLPANVSISGPDDKPIVSIPFERCQAHGCFAVADLNDANLKTLRTLTEAFTIGFELIQPNNSRQSIRLRTSNKGLSNALDAFSKEAAVR